jgi:hypothetical protein
MIKDANLFPRSDPLEVDRYKAPNEALSVLADRASTMLPRSLVGALFDIGFREESEASSTELALIDVAKLMLGSVEIH